MHAPMIALTSTPGAITGPTLVGSLNCSVRIVVLGDPVTSSAVEVVDNVSTDTDDVDGPIEVDDLVVVAALVEEVEVALFGNASRFGMVQQVTPWGK